LGGSITPCVTETAVFRTEGTSQELSVDDYLVGRVTMFDAQTRLPPAGELKNLILLSRVDRNGGVRSSVR
jgi:hypothetical protein